MSCLHRWLVRWLVAFASLAASATVLAAGWNTLSVAEAQSVATGEDLDGASTLVRGRGYLEGTFHTTGLEANTAYTAWWVVYNRPSRCSDDVCDFDDIFVDPSPPRTSVMWAGGFITGADGVANVNAKLTRRNAPGEKLFGPGLRNVRNSVVQIYVRTHGTPLTGDVAAQLSTYAGGCDVNDCEDVQVATHLPPGN